jgi:hypothetical protein
MSAGFFKAFYSGKYELPTSKIPNKNPNELHAPKWTAWHWETSPCEDSFSSLRRAVLPGKSRWSFRGYDIVLGLGLRIFGHGSLWFLESDTKVRYECSE